MDKIKAALAWLKGEILTYPMWLSAAVAVVVAQGTTLGFWSLDATQVGILTAAVAGALGIVAAILTDKVGVAVIVNGLQAVAALTIGFHFQGSDKVGLYMGVAIALLGAWGHTQNSPAYGPHGTSTWKRVAVASPTNATADWTNGYYVANGDYVAPVGGSATPAVTVPIAKAVVEPATIEPDTAGSAPDVEASCPKPLTEHERRSRAAKKGAATRRADKVKLARQEGRA